MSRMCCPTPIGGEIATDRVQGANASGEATVTIIAGNAGRSATLMVMLKAENPAAAYQTVYTPTTGAPDPVTSDTASVVASPASRSTVS